MYGKIFSQIYDSSIVEHPETRFTLMDLVILSDRDGIVDMTHEAIARRTNRPIDVIRATIAELEGPDPRSRNPEHGGARIERLDDHRDWGWRISNHNHFRQIATMEQLKDRARERMHKVRVAAKLQNKANKSEQGRTSLLSVSVFDNKEEGECEGKRKILQREVEEYAVSIDLPRSDGTAMYLHWEEIKWPKNWKLTIQKWKLWNYLPSQKIVGSNGHKPQQKIKMLN